MKNFTQTIARKKTSILSMTLSFVVLILPQVVKAQVQLRNPLGSISTLPQFINALLDIVVFVGIPIIVMFIIYAGFLFVTARGDTNKLTRARHAFVWVLVGAGIILAARIIAAAIANTVEELR